MLLLLAGLVAVALPTPGPVAAAPPDATIVSQLTRVAPGKGRVALTFDGDAFPGRVTDILTDLRRYNAHATFFLTGSYMDNFPSRARAIATAGQEIASHGYIHRDFRGLTDGAIVRSLTGWVDRLRALTGRTGPPFWRAPYGYSDNRVRVVAANAGFRTIYWTLDSLDTVGAPKSATFIYNRLLHSSITLDGAILLLHVNPNGTIDALPRVLAALQARHLRVVSVSQLLAP